MLVIKGHMGCRVWGPDFGIRDCSCGFTGERLERRVGGLGIKALYCRESQIH